MPFMAWFLINEIVPFLIVYREWDEMDLTV